MKTASSAKTTVPDAPLKGQWSEAAARWEYRPAARSARSTRRRERVNMLVRGAVITGTLALTYWLVETLLPDEKPALPAAPSPAVASELLGSTVLSLAAGWLLRSSLRSKKEIIDAPAHT